MHIILYNISWMAFNVYLALIPVVAGSFLRKTKSYFLKLLLGVIWILFLPNTLYLLTDITHLFEDIMQVDLTYIFLLLLEYIILMLIGWYLYVFCIYEMRITLRAMKIDKHTRELLLYSAYFVTGFGIILGRVERTNSWYIFTNFPRVIHDGIQVVTSPRLLFLAIAAIVSAYAISALSTTTFFPQLLAGKKTPNKQKGVR